MLNQEIHAFANPAPTNLSMDHGGHELFDMEEVIAGVVNVLDQYMIFRQYVQCQELLGILDRQYQALLDSYNITVESFSTGQPPTHAIVPYKMQQSSQVVFGLQPTQPKKPNLSLADVKDKGISGHMLGLIKSTGSTIVMSAMEVTNPVVRAVLTECVPNYIEMAYEIFLYQNKHRYYQVPQLAQSDMQQMLTTFVTITGQPTMPKAQTPLQ